MAMRFAASTVAVLMLVSCAGVPRPPVPPTPVALPAVEPSDLAEPPEVPRWIEGEAPRPQTSSEPEWSPASALDLDSWAFGWVVEPATTGHLGLAPRFWSDQKQRWKQALASTTPPPVQARRLEQIFHDASSSEEALRAAWLAATVYRAAGLQEEARLWTDRAFERAPLPELALDRIWDQTFRIGDAAGARALWPTLDQRWTGSDASRKARLLRQELFSGTRSLAAVGADDYVSAEVLDRDDLWAATWNGAIARWSLVTDELELMAPAGPTVAPVKMLAITGWFVYAFQDQLMLRYSKVTGGWRSFGYPPGWTGLRVQGVVADGEESLWVATLGQGLWHWVQGEWTLVDGEGGGPFLNALAPAGDGRFWIGTKDRGLWLWDHGIWTVVPGDDPLPVNVSVIQPDPKGTRWLIGTWGEGTWMLENGQMRTISSDPDYVTAAAWTEDGPVWGALDIGLVRMVGGTRTVLGPSEGLPPGGVSCLVVWEGRWIWGTTGQGWGWWSEYENPALFR